MRAASDLNVDADRSWTAFADTGRAKPSYMSQTIRDRRGVFRPQSRVLLMVKRDGIEGCFPSLGHLDGVRPSQTEVRGQLQVDLKVWQVAAFDPRDSGERHAGLVGRSSKAPDFSIAEAHEAAVRGALGSIMGASIDTRIARADR